MSTWRGNVVGFMLLFLLVANPQILSIAARPLAWQTPLVKRSLASESLQKDSVPASGPSGCTNSRQKTGPCPPKPPA